MEHVNDPNLAIKNIKNFKKMVLVYSSNIGIHDHRAMLKILFIIHGVFRILNGTKENNHINKIDWELLNLKIFLLTWI